MKKFIMLVGIPGSGKSTWVEKMLNLYPEDKDDWIIVSSDQFIEKRAEELGKTYTEVFPDYIKIAGRLMDHQLSNAIKEGKNIIWDQTNLTPNARKGKLDKIPQDYTKEAVYFDVPDDLDDRLASRKGKFIPDNVLESMKKVYTRPDYYEGFETIKKGN